MNEVDCELMAAIEVFEIRRFLFFKYYAASITIQSRRPSTNYRYVGSMEVGDSKFKENIMDIARDKVKMLGIKNWTEEYLCDA